MESGIQPVMPVGNYGDGYGYGGGFIWAILIFALLGGGGFGGWGNRGNMATQADVYAANDMQDAKSNQRQILSSINGIGNGLADLGYALNTSILNTQRDVAQSACMLDKSIMQGNYAVEKAVTDARYVLGDGINQNRFATQQGFADTGRNIDSVKYENAMNTCKITETDTFNTQKILDKLNCMEMNAMKNENENLRMQLADARMVANNQVIANTVAPCPRPAWIVPNPYCNCNGGCGCGINYGAQ